MTGSSLPSASPHPLHSKSSPLTSTPFGGPHPLHLPSPGSPHPTHPLSPRESSPPLPPLPSGEGEPCATSREHVRIPQQHALWRGVPVGGSGTRGASMGCMDPLRCVPLGRKFTQARELRRDATSTERYAWSLLRNRGVHGLKFRRQHVLHGFVVDFYCAAERLVLELEGAPHAGSERRAHDTARAAILEAAGYRVIRIANRDVTRDDLTALLSRALEDRASFPLSRRERGTGGEDQRTGEGDPKGLPAGRRG